MAGVRRAQQQAYIRIARMIAAAIDDMSPPDVPSGQGDAIRRTRSAFVVGGRGTGKTTVLDTFRRDSRPSATWRTGEVLQRPELDDQPRQRQAALAGEREDLLQRIRGRVVWLETLDMEPLPPETNLLASILVRLEEAAKGYSGELLSSSRRPRGLTDPTSEYHSALLALQRLQTDVALAWDGNLRDRKGSLDPDAYAVEVMRVERARLSLNTKFAETLQKLAAYVFLGRDVKDVLFILPVDDFDLNPPICLDLLRVLRLISIPRLFTIVLGDLNVASTVLSLKLSNDLGSIVRRLQAPMIAVLPSTVASLAGDVAANAIRKLLPPGQRIDLLPMQLPESMNFRPLGSADAEPYLHELFADCPVYPGWELPPVPGTEPRLIEEEGSSLRELLLAPAMAAASANERPQAKTARKPTVATTRALPREVAEAAIYSGTKFIQAPPRRVADTWLELYKISESRKSMGVSRQETDVFEPLLGYFAEACRQALRETSVFLPEERDIVERAVSRTVAGVWTLRALPLSFRTETTDARPIELTPAERRPLRSGTSARKKSSRERLSGSRVLPAVQIHTAESLGWQMEVYDGGRTSLPGNRPPGLGSGWEDRRPRRLLSDNAVTALIMYHDLLAFSRAKKSLFATPLLTPSNVEIDWAATEWMMLQSVRFAWPAPPSATFFDYDRFRATWNLIIRDHEIMQPTDHDLVAARLAFAWLSVGTAVVIKEPPVLPTSWDGPLPWTQLVAKLEQIAPRGHAPQFVEASRRVEWLKRVGELLMPEMGLPAEVINQFNQGGSEAVLGHQSADTSATASRKAEGAARHRFVGRGTAGGGPLYARAGAPRIGDRARRVGVGLVRIS
jgi:hypothetical protein